MTKTYVCPKCGERLRLEDLIAEDDASTRNEQLLYGKPPKHLTVESEYADGLPVTTIRYKRISPSALFLIPFTCVWAGGSMAGIYGSQIAKHAFDLKLSLFGIPFVIGSVVLVLSCLFALFGKHVVTLSCGNGMYFRGVGPFGRTTRFGYNRETKVLCDETAYRVNGRSLPCLKLTNLNAAVSVKICTGMDEDALEYIAALLRRECKRV